MKNMVVKFYENASFGPFGSTSLCLIPSLLQSRNQLAQRNSELEEVLHETETRLDEEEDRAKQLLNEQRKLQSRVQELEDS